MLEVGKYYKTKSGKVLKFVSFTDNSFIFNFPIKESNKAGITFFGCPASKELDFVKVENSEIDPLILKILEK